MSNPVVIAAVTATLRKILEEGIKADTELSGTELTTRPPDRARNGISGKQLNLFLYNTAVNAAMRNQELPGQTKPNETSWPPLGLDLFYLLTAYEGPGDEPHVVDQRLLGTAMSVLHDHPVLTADELKSNAPDLNGRTDRVRITPQPLSLEEISKLWATFQTGYRLSVAYQVSVVLIESARASRTPLPVRERRSWVLPYRGPVIEQISPQIVESGGALTIRGQHLKAEITKLRFGSRPPVDADLVRGDRIEATLPAGLLAGVNTVQVMHLLDFQTGAPAEPHPIFESNVAAFSLIPEITGIALDPVSRGATLTVSVAPAVGYAQRAALLIGDRAISIPARPAVPATTTELEFPIPSDFPTGEHLLRLRIDGADSVLEVDEDPTSPTFTQYIGPKVQIT